MNIPRVLVLELSDTQREIVAQAVARVAQRYPENSRVEVLSDPTLGQLLVSVCNYFVWGIDAGVFEDDCLQWRQALEDRRLGD